MTFPQRLVRARKKRKLSQTELARRLGRSKSSVCEWEKGVREPNLATLREIADVLEHDVAELIG